MERGTHLCCRLKWGGGGENEALFGCFLPRSVLISIEMVTSSATATATATTCGKAAYLECLSLLPADGFDRFRAAKIANLRQPPAARRRSQVSLMCANAASGIAEACIPDGNYTAMAFELVVTWAGAGVAVRGAVLQCMYVASSPSPPPPPPEPHLPA